MVRLEESTWADDYARANIMGMCAFYKQLKTVKIDNDAQYEAMRLVNFHSLAVSFPRFDETFELGRLEPFIWARFVGLLASLTLHHFSKSSKEIYFHCLDLRGLETARNVLEEGYPTYIYGFEGMLGGNVRGPLAHYQACFGRLSVRTPDLFPLKLPLVKRYTAVEIHFLETKFNDHVIQYCETLFHSKIKSVSAVIWPSHGDDVSFKKLLNFLDYCKGLKQLDVIFEYSTRPMAGNPVFADIKSAIECWARQAPRLRYFFFRYKEIGFQLHKSKLRRLVQIKQKWYWSDRCDIDSFRFKSYNYCDFQKFKRFPLFFKFMHYDDIFDTLFPPKLGAVCRSDIQCFLPCFGNFKLLLRQFQEKTQTLIFRENALQFLIRALQTRHALLIQIPETPDYTKYNICELD